MKYARRMILLPELEYLALKGTDTSAPVSRSTTTAKRKKSKVSSPNKYKKKGKLASLLNDEAAVIKLTQELGKKIRMRQQDTAKLYKPAVKIIDHLPPIYQAKAKKLLAELTDAGIKYTDRKEVVLTTGDVISQSNIIDLVKESLVPSKRIDDPKPTGWGEFIENVASTSMPLSLFKNQTRRAIEQARTEPIWEVY